MSMDLLDKIRKMNWVLQESTTGVFSFNDLCRILSELEEANVYVVNRTGKVLGVHYKIETESAAIVDPETGIEKFPTEYSEALLKVNNTMINVAREEAMEIFKYEYDTFEKFYLIIPIISGGHRLGTLVATRYLPKFSAEDVILGEYGATVIGLEILRRKTMEHEEEVRKTSIVQMAIATLSYSEIEAVRQIFKELKGTEGLLVASKIADRSGITRSVIVNALRKLESAGVIETRSLGMKGTHIKILNSKFNDELAKISD
ncbi:GTP-sensing pleiotropic transcriptional regulator CodY [Bacillota bacterium]